MWESGFFNSVNGDRVYNAEQMSAIFEGLITDGVYEGVGDKLAVQPNEGMTIQLASGRGWCKKHWFNNTAPYQMTLEESDVTLNRYCAVCIRADDANSVRSVAPVLKYSEYATTPVKPQPTNTETVKELVLAYIYIGAGVSEITASAIEDKRADESVCGWVTGLIEQLSSATLFDQFTAIFNNWYGGLQDLINENTETMLVNALPVSLTVSLSAEGWTWNNEAVAFTQSVTVTGMNDTKTVLAQPNKDSVTPYSASEIRCYAQSTNSLTFTAVSIPSEAVSVDIVHMGV